MTREQKFELVAIAVGAIVIGWWLTRGDTVETTAADLPIESTAPYVPASGGASNDYLSYNLPKMEGPQLPTVTPPSAPMMPTTSAGCPAACGCSGNQQYFTGNQAFVDFLNNRFSQLTNDYAQQVASVTPSWLGVNFIPA